MKNKFTSLSLGIIFSLSCLTGQVIAMEDIHDDSIIESEVINEQNLEQLLCREHNEGKKLTTPNDKEKSGVNDIIPKYTKDDALDCLQKLKDNVVSKDKETLYSINKYEYNFRLDQSSSVTTENQSSDEKDKKSKTSKYKNKRNKKISQFDDTSSGGSTADDDNSFDEQESNKKGDAIVKINVQKGKDTYCEVIVKRDVLKYFGMLSNKAINPDSVLRETVNKIVDDANTKLLDLCKGGRTPGGKKLNEWKNDVTNSFDELGKILNNELNEKLSTSPEAQTSWNDFWNSDFQKKDKRMNVRKIWDDLKTKLSNLLKVEDNKNENNIDQGKLSELTNKIKEALTESLKYKKVYAICFK